MLDPIPQQPVRLITNGNLHTLCDTVVQNDSDLQRIIMQYGYPPFWDRPNTFETLVHIILEQQVSLASARATLEKLQARVERITPASILAIEDHEFKGLYVSRQKQGYIQGLAQEIERGALHLEQLATLPDDSVRQRLVQLKGIGNWTVDVYLIMVLHRADCFPFGDVAALTGCRQLKELSLQSFQAQLTDIVHHWQPYRSVATILLWHYYLASRGRTTT